ncbi:MAG: NAD-dependent epimerase/dehydratase family protein [Planctomycetes bacterium]|nr:NAD-dependent epimerase/dehydratase family protein [Planctomycetota bacterium]
MQRVLLTGGAGFIGSHLADLLVERGHRVAVLDDLSAGSEANLARSRHGVDLEIGSVLDAGRVLALMRAADRVIHLAAPVGVERVCLNPACTREVIVRGSENVLAAARGCGVPAVMVSSSEVYGFAPPAPVRESDVPEEIAGGAPRLSYACAKLVADRAARLAAAAGQPVLTVRPFNVVGPRQGAGGGAVLPRFVERALLGLPLEVHGDGLQQRTFIDARDLARILADLAEREAWPVEAVNAGGVEELSIAGLARLVKALLRSAAPVRHVTPPAARGGMEVRRRVPDLSRLEGLACLPPLRPMSAAIAALAAERAACAAAHA